MLFRQDQSKAMGFCTTWSFKILVSERKYKNNVKNRESQKKYFTFLIYIMFRSCLTTKSSGFTGENLFFYMYSVHAARTLKLSLEIILSPPKWGTKHLYNSCRNRYNISIFKKPISSMFLWCAVAGCKFWDLLCKIHVSDWISNPEWKMFNLQNLPLRRFSTSKFIRTNWHLFLFSPPAFPETRIFFFLV